MDAKRKILTPSKGRATGHNHVVVRKEKDTGTDKKEEKLVGLQNLYSPSPVIPTSELPKRFQKPGLKKFRLAF